MAHANAKIYEMVDSHSVSTHFAIYNFVGIALFATGAKLGGKAGC